MPSDERLTYGAGPLSHTSKVRVAELAARQFGQVTWAQLRAIGVAPATIRWWTGTGYLLPMGARVYAVGHLPADEPSRLFSLILFAGPGAALSHGTAAHWRGWLRYPVRAVHISTPRHIRARFPSVVFHGQRDTERQLVTGIPCTTLTQTLLDLAAAEPPKLVRRSLAQLDYERKLDPDAIRAACGRGRRGSAPLLQALSDYMPELARARSELEDDFLYLCQRFAIPLPEVNASLDGLEPDCYWPELRLVVELDGEGNHGTPPQRNRDQRKDLKLRARGLTVVRYTWDQVTHDAAAVAADVLQQMERCSRRTG